MAPNEDTMERSPRQLVHSRDIKQNDVVIGKGTICAFHIGTIAWKAIVESRLATYMNATRSSAKKEKTRLSLEVLGMIHSSGGRFLTFETSQHIVGWYEMGHREARIKVRDAFRSAIKNLRERRQPFALLDKIGLSKLLHKNSTYHEMVDHISKSSEIQQLIHSYQNNAVEKMRRNEQQAATACVLGRNRVPVIASLDSSIDIWIPEGSSDTSSVVPLPNQITPAGILGVKTTTNYMPSVYCPLLLAITHSDGWRSDSK